MRFRSVWAWLLTASFRNFVGHQLRRLRRPRYLVPAALASVYLWATLRSKPFTALKELLPPAATDLAGHSESIGTFVIVGGAVASWVFGKPRPRLTFTEPEIHFLFAGPVTRRQVVHYRLVKLLLQSAVAAVVFTVLLSRAFSGSTAAFGLTAWIALSTLELHAVGASFARARLHERVHGVRLRVVQVSALVLLAAGLRCMGSGASLLTGPLSWMLWPARALVRPALVHGAAPFLLALLTAIVVLVLHYLWVVVAADRFEDSAVAGAERTARRLEALRAGGAAALVISGKARPVPFRLPRSAIPEIVIAWKGLIAMSRSRMMRIFAIVVPLTFGGAVGLSIWIASGPGVRTASVMGVLAVAVLSFIVLIGPAYTGGGLASDLSRLDFLRTLPLSGARVVLGQALAPTLLLTGIWIVLVPAASFLFPVKLGAFERSCLALALSTVGPLTLLLGVVLQASVVVMLPGWTSMAPGPLAFGRMMLASLVQLIGVPILALPAAVAAAVLVAAGHPLIGWAAVPVAAVMTAIVLAVEIALALLIVGRMFEKLDPSDL